MLKPTKDRTLYHLVYLTRHPKGIVEFMKASEKLDLIQKRVRAAAKQDERFQRSRQFPLFADAGPVIDERVELDLAEVEDYWLKSLKHTPERYGTEKLADMLEETGWFESDFQKAFAELARKGLVKNLDGTPKRWKRFIYFDANRHVGERLAKVAP